MNETCDNCKHFQGWITASLAVCGLADYVTGERCPDFEEVKKE